MTVKNPKITLKREDLKIAREELVDRAEMYKEKKETKDPKVNLGNKYICKICEQTFSSNKILKSITKNIIHHGLNVNHVTKL